MNLSGAIILCSLGGVRRGSALELGRLVLDLPLKDSDVFAKSLLRSITSAHLALQISYPSPHLLLVNLPGVSVALVTMPFCLKEAHNTLEGVLGSRRLIGAVALHVCHVHSSDAVASIWAHRGTPRRWFV